MAAKQQQYQLTQEGVDKLRDELKELKEVKRAENLEALKEARAQGDLSENADYDAARNEQARIEARIAEIETILKYHKVIKIADEQLVVIGKTVKIRFIDKKEDKIFHLVGSIEANPLSGKISIESPIGKAIKNHQKGDIVSVKSETGRIFSVEILEID
jgi:transcription elongation factor GreA